jgi:outer membrane biogenesis lipoprotein LolB
MKKFLFLFLIPLLALASCSKQVETPVNIDVNEWMQTHESGRVAYVDFSSGNYIVETNSGYAVVETWSYTPRTYDILYAHFSMYGVQQVYNRNGNYFTQGRIVGNWLSWFQAMDLIDQISNPFNKPQ